MAIAGALSGVSLGGCGTSSEETPCTVGQPCTISGVALPESSKCIGALATDNGQPFCSCECFTPARSDGGSSAAAALTGLINVPVGDAGVATATSIASGLFFTCALPPGGVVKCWGYNAYGMLGDGNTANSTTPMPVSNLTGVLAASANGYNACALLPDKTVDCWGDNFASQLGVSTLADSDLPVPAPGVSDVVQIAVGNDFDCVLGSRGTAECWGSNEKGALGNGTFDGTPYFMEPVGPVSGLRSAVALTAGGFHACALLADTTVQCWGDNEQGQLGIGTIGTGPDVTSASPVPVTVVGLTGVKMVSAGYSSTCALLADGSISCWGEGAHGQLGNGTTTPAEPTPVKVSGVTGATAISVAGRYACAILANQSVVCWGDNEQGTLGDGTTTNASVPVPVPSISNATGIATGTEHTCAQLADGTFACWGNNQFGQLGDGTMTRSLTPVVVHL